MATYMLNPEVPIAVIPGSVEIVLNWLGQGAAALVVTSGGRVVDDVVWPAHPSRSIAVLPESDAEVTIGVRSTDTFPAGSHAGLTLRIQAPDGATDEIQVASVDVSGLDARGLVVLTPDTNRLTVRGVKPAVPMSEVAAAARTTARQLLGVEQVGSGDGPPPVLAIDASASMQRLAREGGLEQVLDTIVGVSAVLASRSPRVVLLGDRAESVDEVPAGDVARTVVAALVARPALVGVRTSSGSIHGEAAAGAVFVVTDGIPTDVDAWPDAASGRGHLVIVTSEGWVQATAPGTTVALLDDGPGVPHDRSALVRDLLRGAFPPGSPLERRVAG